MSRRKSDKGCPGATTIATGTGRDQVPYFAVRAEKELSGTQTRLLLREFNTRAELLAYVHCARGGCIAEYHPATAKHIKYRRRNWKGFTDVLLLEIAKANPGAGFGPRPFADFVTRGAFVDPPSPNVICRTPPVIQPLLPPPEGKEPLPPPPPPKRPPAAPPPVPPAPPAMPKICVVGVTIGPGPTGAVTSGGAPVAQTGTLDAVFLPTSTLGHAPGVVTINAVLFSRLGGAVPGTLLFEFLVRLGAYPGLPGAVITPGTPPIPTSLGGSWFVGQYVGGVSQVIVRVTYTCPVCAASISTWLPPIVLP
jgi:hypothetical protein